MKNRYVFSALKSIYLFPVEANNGYYLLLIEIAITGNISRGIHTIYLMVYMAL